MNRLLKRALWNFLVLLVVLAGLALLSLLADGVPVNYLYDGF